MVISLRTVCGAGNLPPRVRLRKQTVAWSEEVKDLLVGMLRPNAQSVPTWLLLVNVKFLGERGSGRQVSLMIARCNRDRLSFEAVCEHPWYTGPVPTKEAMRAVMDRRLEVGHLVWVTW